MRLRGSQAHGVGDAHAQGPRGHLDAVRLEVLRVASPKRRSTQSQSGASERKKNNESHMPWPTVFECQKRSVGHVRLLEGYLGLFKK